MCCLKRAKSGNGKNEIAADPDFCVHFSFSFRKNIASKIKAAMIK
ncbi:hypothetical protein HOLDEFILI_02649 [Holdemania filiformis DSM 12042]|uniref:Uncharacterized protein n=1 Tax=Holdemania filiformis DSM 12042 TaxID=545696 RepID=B9Y9Z2_9FIRM|nr:hypothetical protein HOLDEFILI_02649 [Holdemania filiformis DSM 12042]